MDFGETLQGNLSLKVSLKIIQLQAAENISYRHSNPVEMPQAIEIDVKGTVSRDFPYRP
jgi:hypothetical protein